MMTTHFRAVLILLIGSALVCPAAADAEEATWTSLVDDPGRFQAAWLYIPADRRGVDAFKETPTFDEQGRPSLPVKLQPSDLAFSRDIKARGTTAFWKRGGVAVLPINANASSRVLLRAGLPHGASVRVDGKEIFKAEVAQDLPDTAEVPFDLDAGPHLLSVHVGRKVRGGWDGRGFTLRLLTPEGSPAPGIHALTPTAPLEAFLAAGAATADLKLVWQNGEPAWSVKVHFSPTLPEALSNQALDVRVVAHNRAAAPEALGPARCTATPATTCTHTLPWPQDWHKARGLLGPAHVKIRVTASPKETTAGRWGRREPLSKLSVADLKLAHEVRGLLDTGGLKGPGADLIRWTLQQLDDALEGRALKPAESDGAIRRRLQAHARALKAGKDPLDGVVGLHHRAYRSPFDGRYQPYALYVPARLHATKPTPMVVALHGFRGTPMKICRAVLSGARPRMFVLCPYGYGDTVFRYVGEDDLFRTMSLVEGAYRVDPERVHLTGVSNGGLGAYEVATHHPDRWASVAVLCALGNVRDFTRIKKGPHNAYETLWLDRISSSERLSNAHGMDMMIVYGAKDRLPYTSADKLVYNLRRAGARVLYTLHEDLGHNVWDRTYEKGAIFRWFARKKRRRNPDRIDYLTRTPHYRGTDGAHILQADWARGARLKARWEDPKRLQLQTEHITEARLPARPEKSPRLVHIEINGEGHAIEVLPTHQSLAIAHEASGWRVWAEASPPPSVTLPRPQGRVTAADLFGGGDQLRGGPQLFVYGTAEPTHTALNRYLAKLDRARWARYTTLDTHAVADRDATASDLANHHLILIGTPAANPHIGRLVPKATSLINARATSPRDIGMRALHPNPHAPGLGLILSTGTTARGAAFSTGLPEILPSSAWATEDSVKPPFDILLRSRTLLGYDF